MKKINLNPVEILFAFDEKDACFASIAIKSLMENRDPYRHYDIHILYTQLSKETMQSILNLQRDNIIISFNNVSKYAERYLSNISLKNDERLSSFYFFFAGEYFLELDKALYLSWDSHILKDVSVIYDQNIGKYLIGGMKEMMVDKSPEFRSYVKDGLGLNPNKFINPALLSLNLKEMRKQKTMDSFIALKDFYSFNVWPLAELMNLVFVGKTKLLNRKWNTEAIYEDEEDYRKDYVVTYSLVKKPWDDPDRISSFDFWYFAKMNPEYALNKQAHYDAELYGEFLPTYEANVYEASKAEMQKDDRYLTRTKALETVEDGSLFSELFFVKSK